MTRPKTEECVDAIEMGAMELHDAYMPSIKEAIRRVEAHDRLVAALHETGRILHQVSDQIGCDCEEGCTIACVRCHQKAAARRTIVEADALLAEIGGDDESANREVR